MSIILHKKFRPRDLMLVSLIVTELFLPLRADFACLVCILLWISRGRRLYELYVFRPLTSTNFDPDRLENQQFGARDHLYKDYRIGKYFIEEILNRVLIQIESNILSIL